jgi:hypothetical protein
MPLPTNVRPNPYQSLADQQWGDVVRAEEITSRQGLNPRSVIGHPSMVAEQSLDADDIAYGQMPVANGMRAAGWEAAANARAAEASQTLQLHGMLGNVYGRRSGVGNRALRVRRMPVSAIVPEYGTRGLGDTYLPVSKLDRGPAHFRGLGGFSDVLATYGGEAGIAACAAALDDKDTMAAVGAMLLTLVVPEGATNTLLDPIGVVFGDQIAACALIAGVGAVGAGKALTDLAALPEIKPLLNPKLGWFNLFGLAALHTACEGDVPCMVRALEAGKKMTEKGWWEKDKWEFKWKYLSGYTTWYKNPLILGGGAVGGLILYSFAKKKKGRR